MYFATTNAFLPKSRKSCFKPGIVVGGTSIVSYSAGVAHPSHALRTRHRLERYSLLLNLGTLLPLVLALHVGLPALN
jgi:hypothetical protein